MTNLVDPVQGLVDYTLEIKPYHSKIVEVLVDYLHTDLVGINIIDKLNFKFIFDMDYSLNYCPDAGYGVLPYGDYYRVGDQIHLNVLYVNPTTNTFRVAGDLTHFFNVGNSPTIEQSSYHDNGSWEIKSIIYDPVSHITDIEVHHLLNGTADGSIVSVSSATFPITRVDATNNLLVVSGNALGNFSVGDIISVTDSTGNDGNWSVTSKFYHLLENATVIGVTFNSITTPVGPIVDSFGNYQVNGYIISYAQSNFDLPEECPYVAPNTARTIFSEDLRFEQGSTLYLKDFLNVTITDPVDGVSWNDSHYGWDETPWDQDTGALWDFGAATTSWVPPFISIGQETKDANQVAAASIVDILQVQGNFAGAFDYQAFDIGPFDSV